MGSIADSRRRQEATERARRRDTNESIERSMHSTGQWPSRSFFCECCDPLCDWTVTVTFLEYEAVRVCPSHFLLAANHENPEVEWVVCESERFTVVQTFAGQASKVPLRTDPRRPYVPEWN